MFPVHKSLSRLLVCCGALLLAACATQHDDELSGSTVGSHVFKQGQPGSVSTQITTIEADVVAIDYKKRDVTLQDAQGNKRTLTIGSEGTNFNQVKVGDHFLLESATEMSVFLLTDQDSAINAERSVNLKAPQGEKPAFLVAESTEFKALISAVDPAAQMATLTFEDGSRDTFKVRPDLQLSEKMLGQVILIRVTEAIALTVSAR